jgi:hypothetical protein
MRIEDTMYPNTCQKKVELSFGIFYFFEKFIISEINEGEHFDWDKVLQITNIAFQHYKKGFKVAYISNRVNSSSMEPQTWIKFKKNDLNFIVAAAIIIYAEISLEIATLEKSFTTNSIKRCFSIEEAVSWVHNLREFKVKSTKN